MPKVSRLFRTAVKLSTMRQYSIAQRARMDPSTLSKLLNGISKVKTNDARVLALAKVLGLPPDACFEKD